MRIILFYLSLALVNLFSLNVFAALPGKFVEVSPGIYRSAQPNIEDLQDLKNLGIKTILTLNDKKKIVYAEGRAAKNLGLNFISNPMSGFWAPRDQQVDATLALLRDQSNYPILIHCQHGEDRTGLIIGLHRVFQERWEPKAAYDEMIQRGFHKSLVFLDEYFEGRTGFED
jgi:protein tyrosine/serine phosphatase